MFITKFVKVRGKIVGIEEMRPNSSKKVLVQCPSCQQIRSVCYRSIAKAGHHICQKCRTNQAKATYLQPGDKYGMVTILKKSENVGCSIGRCDCGTIRDFLNWNLVSGKTKSCGCLKSLNFENIERVKGENHPNWKGGISSERSRVSVSYEYKKWRKDVFERDNYACVCCGNDNSIQTHHLATYHENKQLATDLMNGVTVCATCHRAFHRQYGRKNNSKEQFKEFCQQRSTDITR
jgi:hypothetical protein